MGKKRLSQSLALLRGINVSGKHRLPMADLVRLVESIGGSNVRTYIQSGNVVFEQSQRALPKFPQHLEDVIQAEFGFRPQVFVMSQTELQSVVADNPFPQAEPAPQTLHLFLLSTIPKTLDTGRIEDLLSTTEQYVWRGRYFYFYAPDGIGRSKFVGKIDAVLGCPTAGRNWRTITQLMQMMSD